MKLYKLSLFLIFSGFFISIIFVVLGYAHLALFIIFPVIYSDKPISSIPFIMIFAGILLLMLSPFFPGEGRGREKEDYSMNEQPHPGQGRKSEKKFGGVILIGPIPIIIGNDRKLLYIAGAIAVVILLIFLFYYLGR